MEDAREGSGTVRDVLGTPQRIVGKARVPSHAQAAPLSMHLDPLCIAQQWAQKNHHLT